MPVIRDIENRIFCEIFLLLTQLQINLYLTAKTISPKGHFRAINSLHYWVKFCQTRENNNSNSERLRLEPEEKQKLMCT